MKTTNFVSLLITSRADSSYIRSLALNLPNLPVDWVMYRWHNEVGVDMFLNMLTPMHKKLLLNIPFTNLSQIISLGEYFDGVHLKSHLKGHIAPLRAIYADSKKLIGYSAHSIKEVMQAIELGADYCTLSPIFATPNKSKPLGLDIFKHIPKALRCRIFALGGIKSSHIQNLKDLGLGGFAGISCFES